MSVLFYRNVFPVIAAVFLLAACATTDRGSESATSAQDETPAQMESDAAEVAEPLEDDAEMPSTETQLQTEPTPTPLSGGETASPDGITTGPAQTGAVDGVTEFPVQRYEIEDPLEIEEPLEFETDSVTDDEITRLREELETSESELARSRALEAERDYSSAQAGSSDTQAGSSSGQSGGSSAEQAGISSSDSGESGGAYDESGAASSSNAANAQASGASGGDASERKSFPPGKPSEFSIYFGYNQAALERDFEATVVKHVEYLKANPDLTVEIQGNCDQRGSREYNIALGGRRAHTIKRALELLGVDGDRITTVSFGSEKPIAFGHDEDSWRLNRRADIIY